MSAEQKCILLVEDDEDDVFFMERAMSKTGVELPMQVTRNGAEAIDYLAGEGQYAERSAFPLPCCIFLDLKMPFVTGLEVLEWISNQPTLTRIPVFVLTSSPEARDRQRTEKLGAKAYLLKPPTSAMLVEILAKNGLGSLKTPLERRAA